MNKKALITSTALAVALALTGTAAAQNYPERPVSFVVPFPPGDLEDVLTRIIAEDFQANYGQPSAVINRPGGGGGPFPGAVSVTQAPADGYTIGSFVIDVPVTGPHIDIPELNPNPFEPVGIFLTYPFVLASLKSAPFQNVDELAEYAKNEKVVLGHFGAELPPTQVSLALAKVKGFEWGSEAAFDSLDCNVLASGDVDVMNTTMQQILPCLDQVNVLATVTSERIPLVPDAPTLAEVDPQLKLALWNGLFVLKGTPQEVIDKIAESAKKTMAGERAQQVAKDTGALVYWMDAEAAKAQIAQDEETVGAIGALLAQ